MTCSQARDWEKTFFNTPREQDGEVPRERDFMQAAGTRVAETILDELDGGLPGALLILAGKGKNGGDAVIAADVLLTRFEKSVPVKFVVFADTLDDFEPEAKNVFDAFARSRGVPEILFYNTGTPVGELEKFVAPLAKSVRKTVMIDGVYGSGFRLPLREHVSRAFSLLNKICRKMLRVAVDLPSGMNDVSPCGNALAATITCAVGILKKPLLVPQNEPFAGKIVPCGIGFPCENYETAADTFRILDFLKVPRKLFSDKRDFGKILIVGGSRRFAGALMMNTLAALRAGTGLVTAFCPESVHAAFVARAPAAMWIPCKETPDGDLDFADVSKKLDAGGWLNGKTVQTVLCGSGLGRSRDAAAIARKIAAETEYPASVVLDADAIFPEILSVCRFRKNRTTVVLPHAGELARIEEFLAREPLVVRGVVKKGRFTQVCTAGTPPLVCTAGTPVLARGGSGDLLAGMTAALLAQFPEKNLQELLAAAVCWHGLAGQRLARRQGEITADISALPDCFASALKSDPQNF